MAAAAIMKNRNITTSPQLLTILDDIWHGDASQPLRIQNKISQI